MSILCLLKAVIRLKGRAKVLGTLLVMRYHSVSNFANPRAPCSIILSVPCSPQNRVEKLLQGNVGNAQHCIGGREGEGGGGDRKTTTHVRKAVKCPNTFAGLQSVLNFVGSTNKTSVDMVG